MNTRRSFLSRVTTAVVAFFTLRREKRVVGVEEMPLAQKTWGISTSPKTFFVWGPMSATMETVPMRWPRPESSDPILFGDGCEPQPGSFAAAAMENHEVDVKKFNDWLESNPGGTWHEYRHGEKEVRRDPDTGEFYTV